MKEVWQNDLELYRDRAPIIRISGNVNDLLPVSTNGTSDFVSLEEYLNSITGSVPNDFTVFYNAGKGFYNGDSRSINRFASVSGVSGKSRSLSEDAKAVDRAMRNLNGNGKMTLVFDSSIRTLRPPYMKGEDILAFSAIRDSFTAKDNPGHKLMFISEEEGDIPSFMIAKPFAQTVTIPLPNQEVRRDFIASQLNGSFTPEQLMKLSKEAEEMSLVELKAAVKGHLNDSFGEVKKAIGVFHNGHSEDAFAHIDTDAVTHIEDSLKGEIFGQDRAIRQVADMVQNGASALNLARRDGSSYSPRGFAVMAGPSGVGKTTIAESFAAACGRPFRRVPLNGLLNVSDTEIIRGSARDAGSIVKAAAAESDAPPVLLMDEVDKPLPFFENMLLDLIDSYQWTDNFVGHVDLSEVLFIFTANDESSISPYLRDRFDLVIYVDDYTESERRHIVRMIVDEENRKASVPVTITEETVALLAGMHADDGGVREMKRHIREIIRRLAADPVALSSGRICITEADAEERVDAVSGRGSTIGF